MQEKKKKEKKEKKPSRTLRARSLNHSDNDLTIETRLDYWERFDTTA